MIAFYINIKKNDSIDINKIKNQTNCHVFCDPI